MIKSVARLYKQFKPEHYDLFLSVDQKAKTFKGTVTVRGLKTGRPSQRLVLHQKDLKINSARLTYLDKKNLSSEIKIDRINSHNSYDELRLRTKELMRPGSYVIVIDFSGVLNDRMHGLYPCYFEHEGKKKQLIATQFESHHAREAFPCVDEPEAKATFSLSIESPIGEAVLSNTPVKTQANSTTTTQITQFETTPKMSTYLLAFAYIRSNDLVKIALVPALVIRISLVNSVRLECKSCPRDTKAKAAEDTQL